MKAGHIFTIEPMINEGTAQPVPARLLWRGCRGSGGSAAGDWHDELWPDQWTAVTADGRRSAQFEETLLVTRDGVEVLTRRAEHDGKPYFMAP